MKCPKCKAGIGKVTIISTCFQTGTLKGNKVIDYDGVESIGRTLEIDCPMCGEDITKSVKENG